MKVVVGLGNPGSEYAHTRHNLGYRVVDLLAERLKGTWSESAWYFFCRFEKRSGALLLVKPLTFMNRSGVAVADVRDRFDVDTGDVLVVVDDVHLDLGRIRLRRGGSDGGHNGLGSIIDCVGSAAFPRLRVGVGAPPEGADRIEHVLSRFENDEAEIVDAAVREAAAGVKCWMEYGIDAAMNRYNS
ncbi:MAG: aminoacyl-tRNA hydrolase [Gemmatimonadota bacterium]|nr:aminoacyl-tRNA hydrolase [Gemmatimonadota bacterium]